MPALQPGEVIAEDFSFRHASRKRKALEHVTFRIAPGEKVLVLGPSGAGKSTLLAAIMGLLADDEGDATGSLRAGGVAGMVLQDPDSQVIASRVGDDVAFGCENLNFEREEIWRRVPPALKQVGLDLPLDHPTAELSGGQKQRLALAGVLAMGADVVLLDEPTANLDAQGVREVVDAVSGLDATCIVVEHRVDTWIDHVDTVLVVTEQTDTEDGVVIGPVAQVLAEHGESLAAQGVWVPGIEPDLPEPRQVPSVAEPAITATELVVGWDRPVAGPLNFSIPKGASTVITGANGAGKSTVLLTLAGLLEPMSGEVVAHGFKGHPHRWKSKELASRFGYVFQDPEHQFVARTVEEELLVGVDPAHYQQRAGEILRRLRLDHLAKANPFTLSGGQKRRLSVATCLVHTPGVVFLDEPTFGQDRTTFTELVHLVRELTDAGTTVVSITHDPAYLRALGDEVIAL